MANEFKIKNGLVVDQGGAQITGSVNITGSANITHTTQSQFIGLTINNPQTWPGSGGTYESLGASINLISNNASASISVNDALGGGYREGTLLLQTNKGIALDIGGSNNDNNTLVVQAGSSTLILNNSGSNPRSLLSLLDSNAGSAVTEFRIGTAQGTSSFKANGSNLTIDASSIIVNSITGSLQGTASWSSNAATASYAVNGGVTQIIAGSNISLSPANGLGVVTIASSGGGGSGFPYSGSAVITGSLLISGSSIVTGSLQVSNTITANTYVGDGSQLINVQSTATKLFNFYNFI